MVAFSWKQWLGVINCISLSANARRPRQVRLDRVEGLEARALLTANLPVAVNDSYQTDANTTLNGASVLINDTDADGDTIDQAFVNTLPSHGSVTMAANGTFTYVPTSGFSGTDTFTYTARDSVHGEDSGNFGTVTINVDSPVNGTPVANSASFNTGVNTPLTATLTGSDPDGDSLIFHTVTTGDHGGLSLNSFNGEFTYTPFEGFVGTDSFTFIVSDGFQDSAPATVTINVGNGGGNTAPVAIARNLTTPVSTTLNGTLTGSDSDGDTLTFAVGGTTPSHGTVTVNFNGTFSYTPTAGYTGNDEFTFTVNDGTTNSAEATVTIDVGGISNNHAPVATSASVSTSMNTALHGTLIATDDDGDPLTYNIGSTLPAHGALSINTNGTYTYLPSSGFTGTDSFSFRANDGFVSSNEATITITVGAVGNSAPVANSATINTAVNTPFSGNLTGSDADGDSLVFISGSPASHGSVIFNPNGAFTYIPDSGFTGTDSFTFRVSDGTVNSAPGIVTVNVGNAANTPPVAQSMTVNTAVNTAFGGTLHATDADGDSLIFSAGINSADHGTVTINASGSFVYTPDLGFTGDDFFSFKVNDGTVNSADALVTIHVGETGNNTAPVANSKIVSTQVNTILNGTLTGTDADGDPLIFTLGSVTADHGAVALNLDGTFSYVPTSGYTGDDIFSFKVHDGTINSTEALVIVHVLPINSNNHAPTVVNGNSATTTNVTLQDSLSPLGTDIDGNALTYTAISQPTNGTLSLNPDGTFAYTPDAEYTGSDSFTFRAGDGLLSSNLGTFTISVGSTSDLFTLELSSNPGTIASSKQSAVPLDASARVANIDPAASFANAAIRVEFVSGADRPDRMVILEGTSSSGAIDVRGKRILFNGSEVARISGGRRGAALQVDFNSNATADSVTAVLQKVAVRTTKQAGRSTRTIEIKVSAGGTTRIATMEADVA